MIALDTAQPIWGQVFTIAPLIVVGTREKNGYDLAPKHMASPIGHENYFGFVCTPRHGTYHNAKRQGGFTVSYPKPDQVVITSLAASPRCGEEKGKPIVEELPFHFGKKIDAPILNDAYLGLECELVKIFDGFGDASLITGKVIAAEVDEDYKRLSDRDEQEMIRKAPYLAYLAHGRFARIENSLAFPYPKDFSV